MCAQSELVIKVQELKEWQALLDEATETVEAIKDFIKAEMLERDVEEMEVATHICRFTTVTSSRFDTTSFKKSHCDLYQSFIKQVKSRRFTVS